MPHSEPGRRAHHGLQAIVDAQKTDAAWSEQHSQHLQPRKGDDDLQTIGRADDHHRPDQAAGVGFGLRHQPAASIAAFHAFRRRSFKMRSHWQAKHFFRQPPGDGQRVGREAEILISFLHVRWDRIMNQGSDTGVCQILLQSIAVRAAHNVKVPYRIGPVRQKGKWQTGFGQIRGVCICDLLAAIGPFDQVRQLDA